MSDFVRPGLELLEPGIPRPRLASVQLDCNESPRGLPEGLKNKVAGRIRDLALNRYPDDLALTVREQVARKLGVGQGQVVLGSGLDEIILMIMLAFGAGRRVVLPVPGFSCYKTSAVLAGAQVVEVPLKAWLDIDADKVVEEAARELGIVIICNPYNPTGKIVPCEIIERLLQETESLVVVDEAYWEFAGVSCVSMLTGGSRLAETNRSIGSSRPIGDSHGRLIVLRTLSKAFSLAGIRFGYAVTDEDTALELSKAKLLYNVSSPTLAIAQVVLEDVSYVADAVSAIIAERERLFWALMAAPHVVPFPSSANFILFTTPYPAEDVRGRLLEKGIAVRFFPGEPVLGKHIRVSVGAPDENDAFLKALDEILVNDDQRAVIGGGFHA